MTNGVQTNGVSLTIANYEPRQPIPSNVKPAVTPANTPDYFRAQRAKLASKSSRAVRQSRGMMLPGSESSRPREVERVLIRAAGFMGPNIYIRALLGLQSGIADEEGYALHHLVKISHERGDKYRFDGFPGLAEALVAKVLEVSSLFYDVKWQLSFSDEEPSDLETLNGLTGTRNILDKLGALKPIDGYAELQPEEFTWALGRIIEAGLVLRNMVMLEENAMYLSKLPLIRDFLIVTLNLPRLSTVVELKHYALEIAEQLTRYLALDPQDPLYTTLLGQLDTGDRGALITSLRAMSRISMSLEASNRLKDVPGRLLQKICGWLLVEDEELRNACLDFLYQYTALPENVDVLIRHVSMEGLVNHLVRLLMHNAMPEERKERTRHNHKPTPAPASPPSLSSEILTLLNQHEEPERSSLW